MHSLSTTVQLIGTVVTAFGLFYAYGRATRLPARLREWWERVRHKPRNITIAPASALISVGLLAPDVYTGFKLGENATTDEKFARLESYVQDLRAMFGPPNAAIIRLGKAIEEVKKHADSAVAQALAEAKAALKQFDDELKALHAVDLRIAGGGAVIMAVGYALSYVSWFRF
jgi:hypothetical protein